MLGQGEEQPGASGRQPLREVEDDVLEPSGVRRVQREQRVGRHRGRPRRSSGRSRRTSDPELGRDLPVDADDLSGSGVPLAEPGELRVAQVAQLTVDAP